MNKLENYDNRFIRSALIKAKICFEAVNESAWQKQFESNTFYDFLSNVNFYERMDKIFCLKIEVQWHESLIQPLKKF